MSKHAAEIRLIGPEELPSVLEQVHRERRPRLALIDCDSDWYAEHLSRQSEWTGLDIYRLKTRLDDRVFPLLEHCSYITTLDLFNNGIGDAGAASLSKLTNLTTLNLSNNGIGDAGAASLSKLANLTRLDLINNSIGDAGAASLSKLTNLTALDLRNNSIGDAGAASLSKLTNLTTLYLSSNGIGDAGAASLSKLTNLTTLYLSRNVIGDAGVASLSKLTNLTRLDLDSNNIGDSGALSLSKLTGLTELYLGNNSIGDAGARVLLDGLLASEITNHIQTLDLRSNGDLTTICPQETWDTCDAQLILAAYRRFRDDRGHLEPLNEVKLLVVGNEFVGKTSLIRYLVDRQPRDENEKKTPGAQLREKVDTCDWTETECPVKLHVWDFGGQVIYHGTHRFFLTARSLYLLVLDPRREDDRKVYDWLKIIQNRGDQSPVLIVINKCDLKDHHLELDKPGLKKQYPNIVDILSTSCNADAESQERIAALRKKIIEIITTDPRLRHVHDPIPRSWLRIKTQIEEMAKRQQVLEYASFVHLCATSVGKPAKLSDAITSETEQWALLSLLNDLGAVIAHGVNNPEMPASHREITLLDPNWLTRAVYTLLSSVPLREQHGEFQRKQLSDWLDSTDYPPTRHEFILDMMRHSDFGLLYNLPGDSPQKYLIPEALPKATPDYSMWPKKSLLFRYQYEFLPSGLIPRFIVMAHENLSDPPTRWRTGVVLSAARSKILVRADIDKRRIDIEVDGPFGDARSALNIVLNDLEKVHRLNPECKPNARVPLPDNREVSVGYDHLLKLEERHGKDYRFLPEGANEEYAVGELLDAVRIDRREPIEGRLRRDLEGIGIRTGNHSQVTLVMGDGAAGRDLTTTYTAPEPSSPKPSKGLSWTWVSVISGGAAVLMAIVLWVIPTNEWRAIVAGFVGLFLAVAGIVSLYNPDYFYRRWAAFLIPAGPLANALGFTFEAWWKMPDGLGFKWDGTVSIGFFIAWAAVVIALLYFDFRHQHETNKNG